MYAALLEHAGLTVERRLNLGSTQVVMPALARGDIDLYPEYTGTALLVVLKHAPIADRQAVYELVKAEYAKHSRRRRRSRPNTDCGLCPTARVPHRNFGSARRTSSSSGLTAYPV